MSAGTAAEARPRFPSPSRPGESRPEFLTDPCVSLWTHAARATH